MLLLGSQSLSSQPMTTLHSLVTKIQERHYRWVSLRADLTLQFGTPDQHFASCRGELLYERLNEKLLLRCFGKNDRLVFIFRTFDRQFDLYLPGQNKIYHGNIFDLEDSPNIESHLKPLDLYKALKPLSFDVKRTEIEGEDKSRVSLKIFKRKVGGTYLSRSLLVDKKRGDVLKEVYFTPEEKPQLEIKRSNFKKFPFKEKGIRDFIYFPTMITIVSHEASKKSSLLLKTVKPLHARDKIHWILQLPEGIEHVYLKKQKKSKQGWVYNR